MEAISAAAPARVLRPAMRQVWRDLTFLHWPYAAEAVRPLVPNSLELDLWDGAAWVGLVPFAIEGLTHPRVPPAPWLSHFPETNVRTYVVDRQGRRGVWFFSLDAARLPAVIGARVALRAAVFLGSHVSGPGGPGCALPEPAARPRAAGMRCGRQVGPNIAAPSDLELFLTARFRLFAERGGRLRHAEIEHPPWPLARASVVRLRQDLLEAAGLPGPRGAPLAHFSESVEVKVGWPV